MNDDREQSGEEPSSGGFGLGDIYFVLFRHKWLIILFSAVGVLGALAVCATKPPRYRSEAKLFIRYVEGGKSLSPPGNDSNTRILNDQEAGILNSEIQILRNVDVAQQAALAVGPERILAKVGGGKDLDRAAGVIFGYLEVELPRLGSVITVTYEHPDRDVAREVLNQVIIAYFKKHREMHRPVGLFGDVLTQEVARLRAEHDQTEQQLKTAKSQAGITELIDDKKAHTEQISKIREGLFSAQAELAEHQAALEEISKLVPGGSVATNTEPNTPSEQINEYKNIRERLDVLSKNKQGLLIQGFREGSTLVRAVQEQIAEEEKRRQKLEVENPRLASLGASLIRQTAQPAGASGDPSTELVQIRALKSKTNILNSQLLQIQAEVARVDEVEGTILDLQQTKELQEANLKYFAGSLAQSRIEKAIGAGEALNIGTLQSPSAPMKGWSQPFKKKVKMVAMGPAACGLALAFLIELVLDRSVKRPGEVETKLRLPLFISIPHLSRNGKRRQARVAADDHLRLTDGKSGTAEEASRMEVSAADRNHPLRRFYEGLRNRLIVHFEIWNLKHKPKLVAVTSCGKGAGVTSTAAGLAASLSETGDGSVLLVDMNCEQGEAQHFYKGKGIAGGRPEVFLKPTCELEDALTSLAEKSALVRTNLYGATDGSSSSMLPRALPSRFATLVPKFKASDYDFIIFDMPPVSQTSVTARLAGFMDMVLLVIESEKTNQDVARQASALLAKSKANVSVVLNKTRSYVPARLHPEFLNDT